MDNTVWFCYMLSVFINNPHFRLPIMPLYPILYLVIVWQYLTFIRMIHETGDAYQSVRRIEELHS